MRFDILTIFSHIFDSYIEESILKRAQDKGLLEIYVHNLRDWAEDKHKSVDDTPCGGGPGMVFKIEPIAKAVESLSLRGVDGSPRRSRDNSNDWRCPTERSDGGNLKEDAISTRLLRPSSTLGAPPFAIATEGTLNDGRVKSRVILFSAKGKQFDAKIAKRFSKYDQLILICGRYEGVDERVAQYIADEEISIGPYVLNGGEVAAMVVVEAVARHTPGVLGKKESLEDRRYGVGVPVYTRPAVFEWEGKKLKVPEVLLSGDHGKIAEWRKLKSKNQKLSAEGGYQHFARPSQPKQLLRRSRPF